MAEARGRPRERWTPDEAEQFKKLCGIFCTKKEICSIMGIPDHRTLDNRIGETFPDTPTWEEAFEYYSATGKATLRRKMFELAIGGDKAALIFMAKNYLGMSDNGLVDSGQKQARPSVTTIVGNSKWAKGRAVNE